MLVQGRDIPSYYPQLSASDLPGWCGSGRLRPFKKRGDSSGLDPKSPKGWRRVFPTKEANDRYDSLCDRYASLKGWMKARRVPDEEAMKTDEDRLARSLEKSGRPIFLPGIDQYRYNLFRRRQRETAEISRLFLEIEELEDQLNPGRVWGDPRLSLSDAIDLLQESFFRSEEIEKILSAA